MSEVRPMCPFCGCSFVAQYPAQVFCGPKHKNYSNQLKWLLKVKALASGVGDGPDNNSPASSQEGNG